MNGTLDRATPLFSELLEVLRRQGFSIGVDHYVRLHALLERVGGDCDPRQLQTLLCPIVASTASQQEQFYAAFEQLYSVYLTAHEHRSRHDDQGEVPEGGRGHTPAPAVRRQFRWRFVAAAVVVLALGVSAVYVARTRDVPPSAQAIPDSATVTPPGPRSAPAVVGTGATAEVPADSARRRSSLHYALLFAPLVLFLAAEIRWYRRRRLVLRREREEKPPFVWPIHLPGALNPYERADSLPAAARQLRRREAAESLMWVDVDRSVRATIDALGYPTVRYVSVTKPVEYLILIERAAPRDHQASLFGNLVQALERESVPVTRFYFDGDPRVCYREVGEAGLLLSEVRRKYPGHRLIILGSGEGLTDPITGRLRSWVPTLLSWHDRALLTTTAAGSWGVNESELAAQFIVLPATIEALGELRGLFDGSPPGTEFDARRPVRSEPHPSEWRGEPEAVARRLREHLGAEEYQWLCACALYPELQWELTLHLGSLAGESTGRITDGSLLRLIRLPWFRTGVIPDEQRVVLLQHLRPELATKARSAIVGFLEHSPPPATAIAADSYQLNLAVQRLALRATDRKRRQELLAAVERKSPAKVMQDRVLVQLLESVPSTGVALQLPPRLRRLLFQHGMPAFGWSTAGRFSLAATAMLVIGSFDLYRLWSERQSPTSERDSAVAIAPPSPAPTAATAAAVVLSAVFRIVRPSVTLIERGDSIRLTVRLGSTRQAQPVRWQSTPASVARFADASRAVLTTVGSGSVTIQALSGTEKDTMTLRVVEPVLTSMDLSGPSVLTTGVDTLFDVQALSASGRRLPRPADLRWRSSRPDVVDINAETGRARALTTGVAEMEASAGALSSKLPVTVVEAARVAEDRLSPGRVRVEIRAPGARLSVNGVAVGSDIWRADTMSAGAIHVVATIDAPADCKTARAEVTDTLTTSDQVHFIPLSPKSCADATPDVSRFTRDFVQPALLRYTAALGSGTRDTAFVASLFPKGTREENERNADLLELLRRKDSKLSAKAVSATAVAGLTTTLGEAVFRIELTWLKFGAPKQVPVTFRAVFTGSGGDYKLTECRVVGSPPLR
ncbi:MAG: hypothetical protein ABI877_02255 [Gemmatimonadaceae bacterium]